MLMSKLTKKQVVKIRSLYGKKGNSVRKIATKLNIPRSTVGDVVSGKTHAGV
jgi:IS30 family transposase